MPSETVGIIGAGMAGLICARKLRSAGVSVKLFDKGRGPGGRASTRRTDLTTFDHGAPTFRVTDPITRRFVDEWIDAGVVAPWTGRVGRLHDGTFQPEQPPIERYVGVPRMSALPRHLSNGLDLSLGTRIELVIATPSDWRLVREGSDQTDPFDFLVVTAPPVQTIELIGPHASFGSDLQRATMAPCWSLMLAFDDPLDLQFDAATIKDAPLGWIARNSSKPVRPDQPDAWVLHATSEWTAAHLEVPADSVADQLLAAFWSITDLDPRPPLSRSAHRWRYSQPAAPLGEACLFDPARQLGACGDWCLGGDLEGAILSGHAMAEAIKNAGVL